MGAFYNRVESLNFNIAITRFTNETFTENKFWRERNFYNGCIYGSPVKISYNIDPDMILFVLEMNNTTNKIMGIGVIQQMSCEGYKYRMNSENSENGENGVNGENDNNKKIIVAKKVNIYDDNNYNRFIYASKYRIDIVEDFIPLSLYRKILILERMVFYGKSHSKRGQGIQLIPSWFKEYDFEVFSDLINIFKMKYGNIK